MVQHSAEITAMMVSVQATLDRTANAIDLLRGKVDEKLEQVRQATVANGNRLTAIETNLHHYDARLNNLEHRLDEVRGASQPMWQKPAVIGGGGAIGGAGVVYGIIELMKALGGG